MEMMLLCSVEAWAHHGITCDVLSTAPVIGSIAPRLTNAGYRVVHLPFRSKSRYIPDFRFLWRFYQLCRTQQYNTIHIHTEAAPPLYAMLARLAGVPAIALTVHNTFRFKGVLRFRKMLERKFMRMLGGQYGMVSEAVAECEREVFQNRGAVIRNWIDVEKFRPPTDEEHLAARKTLGIPPAAKVLVTVGNCNAAKNHGELFRALQVLDDQKNLVYLHVGQEQDALPERNLAQQLGLSNRVRFCGSQEDVRTFLWACDLFIMPSLHEGLAIAPLEAIASGCTLILSRVPGLIDLEPLVTNVSFVPPDARSLATEICRRLAIAHETRKAQCLEDSIAVRSLFSPAEGIRIICENLYAMEPEHKQLP